MTFQPFLTNLPIYNQDFSIETLKNNEHILTAVIENSTEEIDFRSSVQGITYRHDMIWENAPPLISLFSLDSLDTLWALFIYSPALGWGIVNISFSHISVAKMEPC